MVGGVVDDDVDGSHVGQGLVDEFLAYLLGPQIAGEQVAFAATLLDFLLGDLGIALFLGEVIDQAIGALHGIENGDGTTDTAVAAGDDGLLAFQLTGSFVGLVATILGGDVLTLGIGTLHVALKTGLCLLLDGHLVAWRTGVNCGLQGRRKVEADLT